MCRLRGVYFLTEAKQIVLVPLLSHLSPAMQPDASDDPYFRSEHLPNHSNDERESQLLLPPLVINTNKEVANPLTHNDKLEI